MQQGQLDNFWQLYGEIIYHAQLAIRYATISQVRPDGSVYRQLLDEEMAHIFKAYETLKLARHTASVQDVSHETETEAA